MLLLGSGLVGIGVYAPLSPVFGFEIIKDGILLIDRDSNLRIDTFDGAKPRFSNRVKSAAQYQL